MPRIFLPVFAAVALGCAASGGTAAAQEAAPGGGQRLEIRSYTASELGFMASSHLILGASEAVLVDAQFTRSESRELLQLVRDSGRRLAVIFVTHARPEHYLGLTVLTQRFPEARVLARPATSAAIEREAKEAIANWQPIYLGDIPAQVVVPDPFEADALELDGVRLRIHDLGPGLPTVLSIPSERALLASDLVSGGVHLWVEDVEPKAWLAALEGLREELPIDFVYPGHGRAGDSTLLDEGARYLAALAGVLARRAGGTEMITMMKTDFPEYEMPILLEQSLRARRRRPR